jgi:hypothetical protein
MYQVIFQVYSQGKWLDYVREPSPHRDALNPTNRWARDNCDVLGRREGKPFRFILEYWKD